MINELFKAVIEKHGGVCVRIDEQQRFGLSKLGEQDSKNVYWGFSLGSLLIRMLAKEKK